MHVGVVVYGSLDTVSGGYLYDRMLAAQLRARGDRVTVFSLPPGRYGANLVLNLAPRWRQRLGAAEVDVLLQDELCHPSLFWLNRRLGREGGYKLVGIVHHLRSSERHPAGLLPLYQAVERAYLRTLDGFVYNSETTRQVVAGIVEAQRPGVVAHPAADHLQGSMTKGEIRQRALAEGPLRLLFLGNVIARKGLETVLAAAATLPPGRWRLAVVGDLTADQDYARRMQDAVARMGLGAYVHFYGRLDDRDREAILAESHLMAMPSHYEGFGIAYLEGMAYGLPAIAGCEGAAHEIVSHGKTGFLVPAGSVEAVAAQLWRLSSDRPWLAALGMAAVERFRAQPTWADSMGRVRQFLVEIGER